MPNYVNGVGSLSPNLMIVGESPGKREDELGQPFVGPSGEMLDSFLFKAGIRRSEVYITNVIKYRPPMNDMKKLHLIGVDIQKSTEELWENEIKKLKPKCILAVGNYALEAIAGLGLTDNKGNPTGILNYRGSIITARDGITKCVPTVHPAALFSRYEGDSASGGLDWTYTKLIQHDINRAVEESRSRELELPYRELQVAHSSLDLFRFFRQYEKLDKAASDIESINCVPVCIGFAFNRHHAISVPLLRSIGKHNLTDMGDNELDEVWEIVDEQLRRLNLIGHNFKYDEYKLSLLGFETPKVYSDTLIKTRVLFPELPNKRLCDALSLWTREPFYKDDGKEFKLGKSKIENLLKYNGRDCACEFELDESQEIDLNEMAEHYKVPLKEYYYNYMMRKHKLYLKFERGGFRVDENRRKEIKKKYRENREAVHNRLVERVGHPINVKSNPQVFDLLYKEMRFKPFKRTPTSEDSIVRLLGNHAKTKEKKDILIDVLEEKRIRTQESNYINFTPDYDNRCKSVFNISATETCRSSTAVFKKPLRPKKLGLSLHTIAAHGRLAKDIKSMFIPDPGYVFIKADAEQAEARVVAVLSEDWDLLTAFDTVDIHRRTAGLMFGYSSRLELSSLFHNDIIDYLDKEGPERFCGKKVRHAGNYDMGKGRFMMEFNTDAQKFDINMEISEWRAGQMLQLFHDASPRIRSVFHRDIKECINSTRCLIDPMGGVRVFNGRMDDELYKEGYANIPQRTVAHLVQGAAIKIDDELGEDKCFMWIGEKHDELIMQVPENNYEPYCKLMKKHMETPIDFSTYCSLKRNYILTIPCDVGVSSTHYGAFTKVKI